VGDVIRVPHGRRAGLAVILDPGSTGFGEPRPLVLTEDRWAGRIAAGEFAGPVEALGRVRVPRHFNHRSPAERRDLAAALRSAGVDPRAGRRAGRRGTGEDTEIARLRHLLRVHPCHACPEREEHARWAERRYRLDRDTEVLKGKVEGRTGSLARTFDQVCDLLRTRGYLGPGESSELAVTDAGRMLGRIWTEADLLVAECVRTGVFEGLSPPELAAAVSVVLYEARREGDEPGALPRGPVTDAVERIVSLWSDLEADEAARGLELTREPDSGFVWPILRWTRGEPLSKVLASAEGPDGELPAGDFVRWARQVVDLLGQLAEAVGPKSAVRETARAAMAAINHGVLAYTAVT
jgi:ATP-dependent RNA helicase HelY